MRFAPTRTISAAPVTGGLPLRSIGTASMAPAVSACGCAASNGEAAAGRSRHRAIVNHTVYDQRHTTGGQRRRQAAVARVNAIAG